MLSVAKPSEKKSDNESRDQSKNKISDFAEKYAQHEQDFVEKDRICPEKFIVKRVTFFSGVQGRKVSCMQT